MTIDRRSIMRALVVFVLAAVAITVFSAAAAQAGEAHDVSALAHGVATEVGPPDDGSAEAAADPDALLEEAADDRNANRFLQSITNGIVFGLLLALASVGVSLIYGTTGLSNFAHGELVSFGAVLTYFLATQETVRLPLLPFEFVIGLPLIYAAIIATIIAGLGGWVQDKFLWSQLRRKGIGIVQQMIVSIGLALALVNLLQWWIGGGDRRLTVSIDERYQIGPVYLGEQTLVSTIIAVVALLAVGYFLLYTRWGRATRAVSDNPALAAASGIKVDSIIRLVWILSATLAAMGGILLALYENGTAFDAGAKLLMLMFAAVTLGGLGHPFGALVGSLLIGLATEMSTLWLAPDLKVAVALAILILVLLVRPQGILGRAERVG